LKNNVELLNYIDSVFEEAWIKTKIKDIND
jgi:hypothetical protein